MSDSQLLAIGTQLSVLVISQPNGSISAPRLPACQKLLRLKPDRTESLPID